MKPTLEDLMKNADYNDAFHMYYQYIGRKPLKRFAMIYKKKMDKIEKMMSQPQ